MNGAIFLHRWTHWAIPEGRVDEFVPWRERLTVAEVLPKDMLRRPGLAVHVNGRRVDSEEWFLRELAPGDHVDVAVRPAEITSAALLAGLVSAAVSVGVSLVLSLILPKPKGPKKRGDDESPTYAWDRKDNNRVEGQPRAVLYGELRVAPQVFDEFVTTQSVPPKSTLNLLLYLGEGQYESIGGVTADNPIDRPLKAGDLEYPLPEGIEINGNPLANYRGVEAHVRLGTNEQEPIPGFEEIHTVSEVGSTLTQAETSAPNNNGTAWALATFPYNSNDASVQAIWTAYAQGFDLPDEADAYTITINFPEGLYKSTTGGLQDAFFQALIRYRELDGFGSPILTGGDNGDGWVYVTPVAALAAHHQGPFPYELTGSFYNPAGFTPGAQGGVLAADVNGSGAYTSLTNGGVAANAVTPWTAGQAIDEFTWEGWYTPGSLPLTGTGTNTCRPIFEWLSTGSYRGISILLQRIEVDTGDSQLTQRWRLRTYFGDGTVTLKSFDDTFATAVGSANFLNVRKYHIAVAYKRNYTGGTDRWRIYLDGILVREITSNPSGWEMLAPAAPMRLLETLGTPNGTVKGFGRMDECRVWRMERSAAQIGSDYNAGAGNFAVPTATLVACWHFDSQDNLVNYTFGGDSSGNGNNITTEGGGTIGDPTTTGSSTVVRPGGGTLLRARYRIQLMRFNLDSNAALIGDQADWESIDGRIDEQLSYPNSVMLALKIPATNQLNTTHPTVTVVAKGRKVPVWDGLNEASPTFDVRWSANPAWVLYDAGTARRFGRGGDFDHTNINLVSFKEWADYCDEKVYDALGRTVIHETDTDQPIVDILYDSTMNAGVGGLQVQFRLGFLVPAKWKVGGFLGFAGLPTSGGSIVLDINATAAGMDGFEITDISFNGGSWLVDLLYDTATLGTPWADGSGIDAAGGAPVVSGTVEGREERFRFDGVFDTFKKTWDAWMEITRCGRAMPVLDGSRLRVRMSKPRSPVGIVGMAQIEPGSFKVSYASRRDRPNLYVTDFLDRDQDWRQKPAERGSPSLEAGAPESAINRENIEVFGLTRRSGVLREMDFMLLVNETLVRQGEFKTGIEALLYEVGDVINLAHDIMPWGPSGRFPAACTGTTITLERQIVLAPATTYYVQIRNNALGQTGSGSTVSDPLETRQITSVAGTYAAGASISIGSGFDTDPASFDPWLIYVTPFQVEIAEITLSGEDFKRKVTWVQYDEDVYDVDDLQDDIVTPEVPPATDDATPGPVTDLLLTQGQELSADGTWHVRINASWLLEVATAHIVHHVLVWARELGTGPFQQVANEPGPATSSHFIPPVETVGAIIEVVIQPVSMLGSALDLDLCTHGQITLTGFSLPPDYPTNLRAVMNGDQVTYLWDPPAEARGLFFELRRGGWCLGQVVGVAPPGSTSMGPMDNWAASTDNAHLDGPPILVLRARDGRGQFSRAAKLFTFQPSVPGAVVLTGSAVRGKTSGVGNTRFEDWGIGWTAAIPTLLDPVLVDVDTATIVSGQLILKIAGSALTGTYTTGANTIAADSRPEYTYVEAFVQADQVPPITIAEMTLPSDDPAAARRSFEGLTDVVECTLLLEWRLRTEPTGSYSAWEEFRPGLFFVIDVQFRITVTRPSTDWNVRIYSFGTRLSRVAPQRFQRTPTATALQSAFASIG